MPNRGGGHSFLLAFEVGANAVRKFYVLGMIAAACLVVAAQAWAGTDVGSWLVGGPNYFQGVWAENI